MHVISARKLFFAVFKSLMYLGEKMFLSQCILMSVFLMNQNITELLHIRRFKCILTF